MLTSDEINLLETALEQAASKLRYYSALAAILILLAWTWYFMWRRPGLLLIVVVMTIGLWYYPWRYWQKKKAVAADIRQQEKITIVSLLENKRISNLNRLAPYYYLITTEEDFEVDKNTYSFIEIGKSYKIVYTPHSKTILSISPN